MRIQSVKITESDYLLMVDAISSIEVVDILKPYLGDSVIIKSGGDNSLQIYLLDEINIWKKTTQKVLVSYINRLFTDARKRTILTLRKE